MTRREHGTAWTRLEARVAVSARTSQLVGWAAVAVVNAVVITVTLPMPAHRVVRVEQHFYDAAELVGMGLASAAAVHVWQRFGPKRAVWAYLVTWLAACVLAAWMLPEDVAVLSDKIAVVGPAILYQGLLVGVTAAGIPLFAWGGRMLRRVSLWPLGVLLGLGAATANHFFADNDYPGMHFFIAWAAAMLIASSVSNGARREVRTWRGYLPELGLAVAAVVALVIPPPNAARLELFKRSGSAVEPWVARLRNSDDELALSAHSGDEWFRSRVHHPYVPPTLAVKVPKNPIVLLLIVDTLRADVVDDAKYAARLPFLARMKRESVVFTRARTPAPATTQAVASLFSGRYYSQLYWASKAGHTPEAKYLHKDDSVRFPELITRAGVDTVHIAGLPGLLSEYGLVRGFKTEQFVPGPGFAGAARMVPKAIDRIRAQGKRGLFMYMQFVDPHYPYDRGGTQKTPFDSYLAEVEIVDRELHHLYDVLEQLHLLDRTVLIVASDHGEAFGEHGVYHHATTLYEEMVRIPLLIRIPGVPHRQVAEPVSLIDLAPTILDMFGLPAPGIFMGQSLLPLVAGEDVRLKRPMALDSSRLMRAMYFRDGFKVIRDRRRGTVELYDLVKDPGEKNNLRDAQDQVAQERVETLRRFFEIHKINRPGYTIPYGR